MSHNFTVRSRLPERRHAPSRPNATLVTSPRCPRRVKACFPVFVYHARTVLSALSAARIIRPSRPLKASPDTPTGVGVRNSRNSWKNGFSWGFDLFHTRTTPFELLEPTHWPSALTATLV